MRACPAAPLNRRANCRSVALSALSGMLLTRPMVISIGAPRSNASCPGASVGLAIDCFLSNRRTIALRCLFGGLEPALGRAGLCQRLVDILDDVGDMLDADREADGLGQHTCDPLLLARHLPMRRR